MMSKLEWELDKRVGLGVRNLQVSNLLEAGKRYEMKGPHPIKFYPEDPNGILSPSSTHCWLTWQSKFNYQPYENAPIEEHWCNQAYSFDSVVEAEEAANYLKSVPTE